MIQDTIAKVSLFCSVTSFCIVSLFILLTIHRIHTLGISQPFHWVAFSIGSRLAIDILHDPCGIAYFIHVFFSLYSIFMLSRTIHRLRMHEFSPIWIYQPSLMDESLTQATIWISATVIVLECVGCIILTYRACVIQWASVRHSRKSRLVDLKYQLVDSRPYEVNGTWKVHHYDHLKEEVKVDDYVAYCIGWMGLTICLVFEGFGAFYANKPLYLHSPRIFSSHFFVIVFFILAVLPQSFYSHSRSLNRVGVIRMLAMLITSIIGFSILVVDLETESQRMKAFCSRNDIQGSCTIMDTNIMASMLHQGQWAGNRLVEMDLLLEKKHWIMAVLDIVLCILSGLFILYLPLWKMLLAKCIKVPVFSISNKPGLFYLVGNGCFWLGVLGFIIYCICW